MKLRCKKELRRSTALAALLLAQVFFSGCNSGTALLSYLFEGDDDAANRGVATGVRVEFDGFEDESHRRDPRQAVIRFKVKSDSGGLANVNITWSTDGALFQPLTFVDPSPARFELAEGEEYADPEDNYPAPLRGLETTRGGKLHRIGWNAFADLGDSSLRQVTLRFEADAQVDVQVEVGNDAPAIDSISSEGSSSGLLGLSVVISDLTSDLVDLAMEVSTVTENPTAADFREMRTVQSQSALASSPGGVVHRFDWRAAEDLGNIDRAVLVRMTPRDLVGEFTEEVGETVTALIVLELNEAPAVQILGAPGIDPDGSANGDIGIDFMAQDPEGDNIDVLLQWAHQDDDFPDLPQELEADPIARRELLYSADMAAERSRLRIATLSKDLLSGPVELPAAAGLSSQELLATWIRRKGELRALGEMSRRPVELVKREGQPVQDRLVCSYAAATGVLTLAAPFDPPAEPGDTLQVDLAAALNLGSSSAGVEYRVIWASDVDVPGGGNVKLRITPFDRVRGLGAKSSGCAGDPDGFDENLLPGSRGTPDVLEFTIPASIGFTPEPVWLAPLAEVDDPVSVAAGDLDQDGMLDLAAISRGARSLVLSFQRASGTFDQLRLLDDRIGEPADLELGDLDGDGDLDAVIVTSHFHTPAFPDEEVPAIEKAGSLMIYFQGEDADYIRNRASLKAAGVFLDPTALALADFDGDGDQDIAVAEGVTMDTALTVFYRGENGLAGCDGREGDYSYCTFSGPANVPGAAAGETGLTDLAAGDVDGDGDADIVASFLSGLVVFENRGAAGFQAREPIPAAGSRIRSVGVLDLDHDGRLDILAIDRERDNIIVAWQLVGGSFELGRFAPESLERPVSMLIADLTLNGADDLLIADSGLPGGNGGRVLVCLADAAGLSGCEILRRTDQIARPQHVAVGDFDGDGRYDVASVDEGSRDVAIYQQDALNVLESPAQTLAPLQDGERPSSFAVADLDADGDLDLAVTSPFSNSLTLLSRRANSSYARQTINFFGDASSTRGASQVISADLDGDGLADLVTANAQSDNLLVLLQDSRGRFDRRTNILSLAGGLDGPRTVAAGDLDGDGRLDLITAGGFSDDLLWFRQEGQGVFSPAELIDTGGLLEDPLQLFAEDINQDGMLDLVATGNESDNVVVLIQRSDRAAFFLYNLPLPEGSAPVAVVSGQLLGDERADIAVAALSGVFIFEQQEKDFLFREIGSGSEGYSPTGLLATDLGGNGRVDLVLANALPPGAIEVFSARTGAGFSSSQLLPGSEVQTDAESFLPAAMVHVDLNRDGKKDFVVANRSGDEMTVFWGGRR